MGFKFSDLLPKSARDQWVAAKNNSRLENPAPPSTLIEILYGSAAAAEAAFKRGSTTAALATGEGQNIQREATAVTIKQYLSNPFVAIIIVLFVATLLTRR